MDQVVTRHKRLSGRTMYKFVRRGRASRLAMVIVPFAALGMSVIASLVLFTLYGKSPALALHALLLEPFLSW